MLQDHLPSRLDSLDGDAHQLGERALARIVDGLYRYTPPIVPVLAIAGRRSSEHRPGDGPGQLPSLFERYKISVRIAVNLHEIGVSLPSNPGEGDSHLAALGRQRAVTFRRQRAAALHLVKGIPQVDRRGSWRDSKLGGFQCSYLWPARGLSDGSGAARPSTDAELSSPAMTR